MNECIQEGDEVTLFWTDGSVLRAVVVNAPWDTGDCWQVKDSAGTIHLINIYASTFESMTKEAKQNGHNT